ncbi:hypothetical protein [Clostridium sp.]|uniref:hypothetical protein n=1 Tax=Clostridium sp. TaxID=1506 RepID=UPI002FCB026A
MKSKRKLAVLGIFLVFFITLFLHFENYYNLYKLPPSDQWSKEVEVGIGNAKNNPIVIKEKDRILIAFDDTRKLHLVTTDLNGTVLSNNTFELNEDFIKDVLFVKTKNGYRLAYSSTSASVGYLENFILDNEFNVVDIYTIKGINSTYQLDEGNYVVAYENKIEFINSIDDIVDTVDSKNASMITGSKTDNGFFICFLEDQKFLNFFSIEGNKMSEVKTAVELPRPEKVTYENFACSTDGRKGYIVIEEFWKGAFNQTKGFEFALDGSSSVNNPIYIDNSKIIKENVGGESKDGGKFYGVFGRTFGKKSYQENLIAYTLKDGKAENVEYVSRTREMCFFPYIEKDFVGFLSFNSIDKVNVNIASTNKDFKKVINMPRASESSRALSSTLESLMFSFAYVFVYGFKWILPTILIAGIVGFFDYAYSEKNKKRGFILLSIIAIAIKTYGIIPTVYETYSFALPQLVASKIVGIGICTLIGALSYYYAYLLYKQDTEDVGIFKFSYGMLIDTVLTLVVFVPYMT